MQKTVVASEFHIRFSVARNPNFVPLHAAFPMSSCAIEVSSDETRTVNLKSLPNLGQIGSHD